MSEEKHEAKETIDAGHQSWTGPLSDLILLMPEETRPEITEVPFGGDKLLLLRDPKLPAVGLLVWDSRVTGTDVQLCFQTHYGPTDTKYKVLCACCASECFGIPGNPTTDTSWAARQKNLFLETLDRICQQLGVTQLFMRNAKGFAQHYGRVPTDVVVWEASAEALGRFQRPDGSQLFPCLDYEQSVFSKQTEDSAPD